MRPVRFLFALGALVAAAPATAQVPSVDARRFEPPTDPAGALYLEPTATPGPWAWNAAALFSWAYRPAVVRDASGQRVGTLVSSQLSWDTVGSIGIGKRLSLGAALPTVLAQSGETNEQTARITGESSLPPRALGDLALTAKGSFLTPADLGGAGVAAVARLTLPTGDRTSYLGEGAPTAQVRALFEYRLLAVGLEGTFGWRMRTEARDVGLRTYADELPWGVAVVVRPQAFGLDPKGRFTWAAEAHGAATVAVPSEARDRGQSAALAPVLYGVSARYALRDVSLFGGLESSATQALGAPPLRVVAGVQWAPRNHDKDGDGIDDDLDQCPELPEDRDGFDDEDGCPEFDVDEDGVGDQEDRCPREPEDADGFEDEDGCPELDDDHDGIPDTADACPEEAGGANADPTKNGCPVRDRDHDGVPDEVDACPDQPEDRDGVADGDGCPDLDDDADGVPDAADACPREAGEPSSDPKKNGCPFRDRDHDGIADDADKCPDAAETWNGVADDDGCPEKTPPPPFASIEKGAKPGANGAKPGAVVRLARPIRWGEAGIDATSAPVIAAVATAALAEPGRALTVAVRPAKGDGARAAAAAARIAQAIGAAAHDAGLASAVPWDDLPRAARAGEVVILVASRPAPTAPAPAAPAPVSPAPAAPARAAPAPGAPAPAPR